jgi:septal ring factor EnvC (AmiA/AmiB activator)
MKKAFEDNLPRFKPRVRQPGSSGLGAPESHGDDQTAEPTTEVSASAGAASPTNGTPAEPSTAPSVDVRAAVEAALRNQSEPHAAPSVTRFGTNGAAPSPRRERPAATPPAAKAGDAPTLEDAQADLRRRKLRSRLAALTSVTPALDPESPRAAEEVLGAAEALSRELGVARERGDRLESELGRARADLDRAVGEVERRRRDYDDLAKKLDGARALLGNLEAELTALEEERDEALYEVGALRAADAERSADVERLTADLDAGLRQLSELKAERAELLRELDTEEVESAALRREVARLGAERARLTEQLADASRAKGALADSRKALEEVHRVLAVARTPAGRR